MEVNTKLLVFLLTRLSYTMAKVECLERVVLDLLKSMNPTSARAVEEALEKCVNNRIDDTILTIPGVDPGLLEDLSRILQDRG